MLCRAVPCGISEPQKASSASGASRGFSENPPECDVPAGSITAIRDVFLCPAYPEPMRRVLDTMVYRRASPKHLLKALYVFSLVVTALAKASGLLGARVLTGSQRHSGWIEAFSVFVEYPAFVSCYLADCVRLPSRGTALEYTEDQRCDRYLQVGGVSMKRLSLYYSLARPTRRLVIAFVLLLGSSVAFGQRSPDIGAILEGISKAYKDPLPYEIVTTTTMQLGAVSATGLVSSKVRLASQDPNKFRLESYNSADVNGVPTDPTFPSMVIIGDGTEVWQVSSDFKQYTKTKPGDLPTIRTWVKAAEAAMFDVPKTLAKKTGNLTFLREESLALEGSNLDCFVIEFVLPDHPESTTLWVEKTRFLIRRTRIEQPPSVGTQGRTVSITTDFPVVNFGVALPDNTFLFTPPPSAIEVDKNTR